VAIPGQSFVLNALSSNYGLRMTNMEP